MAKPIEPTPILKGKDAERFLSLTERAEKSTNKERAEFLKKCYLLYSDHKF